MEFGYQAQYERVKRYFERFKRINDGKPHDHSSPHYDDDIYAFFQNCYHLKDWIKNDPACASWKMKVEPMINGNSDLRICADLCNALKHLVLTKPPRSTESPNFAGGQIRLDITEGLGIPESVGISIKYKISTTSSGDIDAFELASRCMSAWENFIAANATQP